MRNVTMPALIMLLALIAPLTGQTPKEAPKSIYDARAIGSEQIDKGLATAKKDKKNVLLQFGADWCHWCHKLHDLMATDKTIAAELKKNFVMVLIDANNGHNKEIDQKYDNPTKHGLPVIVVLDKEGKILTTQDTGDLEVGDHHDPAKVLAFLKKWEPKK